MAANALAHIFGFMRSQNQLSNTQQRLQNMADQNPYNASGSFGSGYFSGNQFFGSEDPTSAMFRQLMGEQGGDMMQGGMFNDPRFQQAFQGNDMAGAMNQAQGGLQQMMGPNAFGNFGNQVNSMFNMGQQNLAQAGDQQGMMQQSLDAQRAMAAPFEEQARNNFFNTEFGKTMGATSGATDRFGSFGDQMMRNDQNRIMGAQQLGQQQQQHLGNLGMQQMGQGFAGENQGFLQMLQSLQQNQSAGQQRLGNAMGMFGLGRDTQQQQFGMGMQAQQGNVNQNQQMINMMLGLMGADANRIEAQGRFAAPMGQIGANKAASTQGFWNKMFGGG